MSGKRATWTVYEGRPLDGWPARIEYYAHTDDGRPLLVAVLRGPLHGWRAKRKLNRLAAQR